MRSTIFLVAASGLILSACGSSSVADRKRPDEFAVGRQAPLVIPPDYALAPPKPGAPRPLAADSQQQALEALFGPGVQLPPRSALENKLLQEAGANRADPSVRNTVANPPSGGTVAVDKGAFLRELLDAPAGTRNEQLAKVSVGG